MRDNRHWSASAILVSSLHPDTSRLALPVSCDHVFLSLSLPPSCCGCRHGGCHHGTQCMCPDPTYRRPHGGGSRRETSSFRSPVELQRQRRRRRQAVSRWIRVAKTHGRDSSGREREGEGFCRATRVPVHSSCTRLLPRARPSSSSHLEQDLSVLRLYRLSSHWKRQRTAAEIREICPRVRAHVLSLTVSFLPRLSLKSHRACGDFFLKSR